MSFNGSGTFLINTAGQPVVSGTVISSTAFNSLTADLATGLSTAITKDGQTTVTANIPMSTYKFTGLGVGSAATDSANLSQVQSTVTKLLNSVSGADTITATASPTLAAYAAGQMFYFVAAGDNTTSVTLNIDSLGAKAVTRDGSVALAAADIKSGEVIVVVYDGTRFQVVSQLNSAGNATFANVSITSALNVGGVATFTNNPVLSGGTANGVLYLNGSKVATSGSALTFDGTYFTANGLRLAGTDVTNTIYQATGALGISTGSASGITFYTNLANRYQIDATGVAVWSVGGSESMRLTSTGLGIGTASPATKLTVYGSAGAAYIQVQDAAGVTGKIQARASTNLLEIGTTSNNGLSLYTNNTEKALLDTSGNLGLGVTPSAWSGVGGVFEIKGNAYIYSATGVLSSGANAFFNGTNWIYKTTQAATRYEQVNGQHQWSYAASGTAGNAISFTQAMTLDASGNLGVGTTSPGERLDVRNGGLGVGNGTIKTVISYTTEGLVGTISNHALLLYANNTERARITSGGDLLVGTTSAAFTGRVVTLQTTSASNVITAWNSATTGDNSFIGFFTDGGTGRGSITYNRGAGQVAYNITSDARLKENIADSADAGGKIDAMQVRQFDWKETGNHLDYGFVAQELNAVAPHAVSKPEDEEAMWSVDYSKLVPMLVKEIQSLRARVAQLEAK